MIIPEKIAKMRIDWAENDAKRDAGLTEPESIKIYRNISYGPYGEWSLLDIYTPKEEGKYPLVINVHGGGYFYGDKELYRFYCMHIAELGFTVINYNYRLSPESLFPAPLDDTEAVFSWIDNHADEYKLDTENAFLIGDSAGAQLASQYAAILTNDEYREMFGYKSHKTNIRGVCLACGMYDIIHKAVSDDMDGLFVNYFGEELSMEDPRLDVLANITGNYPPVFIFSSKDDFLREACMPMAEHLKSKGISVDARIYGLDESIEVAHTFHENLRSEIGIRANNDQAEFMKGLVE